MKCDHCRGPLRAAVHAYWRMRFCSQPCQAAYLQRLEPNTRKKLMEANPDIRG